MIFIPNYTKLGLKSPQEAMLHIFNFLKKEEQYILKNGLGKNPTATFILGNYKFTLGHNDNKTFEKSRDKRKK